MNLKKTSVAILSALLLVSCGQKQTPQAEAQEYPTEVMSKQNAELQTVYPTTIKGKEDIQIKPRVGGFIENLYIDEGSVVKKGQLLFTINSPQSEQAVLTAQAALNSSQAALNTAEINVTRYRPLAEKGIVSKVQLQTYENAYASAQASLAQAKASLVEAQAALSWTRVSSPVDGIAGQISFRQGSLVTSSDVLTTIANTDDVFAYFSINEKDLMHILSSTQGKTQAEKIKNLANVTLILANGETYPQTGKIETISGLVDVSTGSVDFRAEFPNKEGHLRSGSSGKVVMPKVVDSVFVIPQKATFAQLDKTLVYKVQGDSVVSTIISVSAMPDGKNYAVTEGLNEGDRIVTNGVATLSSGMKIAIGSSQKSDK